MPRDRRTWKPHDASLAAHSFAEAVRRRPHMVLGLDRDNPALVSSLLAAIVADALADRGVGRPDVTITIESDLSFAAADTDSTRGLDSSGQPANALYQTLLDRRRWPIAVAAALSTRTVLEVVIAGVAWRQEFKQIDPTPPEQSPTDRPDGTLAAFDLDADYFAPDATLPHEPLALLSHWARAAHIPDTSRLRFIDARA
jgi:hypothetical protein